MSVHIDETNRDGKETPLILCRDIQGCSILSAAGTVHQLLSLSLGTSKPTSWIAQPQIEQAVQHVSRSAC